MKQPLILFILLITTAFAVAESKEIQQQFDVKPGETINLDLHTGGSVKITGWDKNVVSVAAYPGGRDAEDCEIEMKRTPSGVDVISYFEGRKRSHSTDFEFEISAPKKYNINLESAGGELTIVSLDGNFRGETGGGEITVRQSRGNADLSTGGGEIRLEDSHLEGKITTGGGRVVLKNVTGGVKATTGGGEVVHEGSALKVENTTDKVVEITTGGGAIRVDSAPLGADVSTGGGEIVIRSANRFVKASTGGGSIEIGSVDGSVKASTGAGEISVQVTDSQNSDRQDVTLSSGKGDITLVLPASYDGSIDIELAYTRGYDDSEIISDFPLDLERTNEWSSKRGTPRKYIYGNGKVGSGTNRVRIETVNGNVYLKKAK